MTIMVFYMVIMVIDTNEDGNDGDECLPVVHPHDDVLLALCINWQMRTTLFRSNFILGVIHKFHIMMELNPCQCPVQIQLHHKSPKKSTFNWIATLSDEH